MLGLGNGRRGMKSPPLLVAGLLACVFVLGINYWITSSRCADLQHHFTELEGRMRRAAAERGAVEIKKNEFEEKLEKQMEQIDVIKSLHESQIKTIVNEKTFLLNNITSQEKIIKKLQEEAMTLQSNYNKLQQEMDTFQESQAKKLNYELTQCSIKMKEMTEQCEEKLKMIAGNNVEGSQIKQSIDDKGKTDTKTSEKPEVNPDVQKKEDMVPNPETSEGKVIQIKSADNQEQRSSTVAKESESSKPQNLDEGNPNEKMPGTLVEPDKKEDQEMKTEEPVNLETEFEDEVERENLISLDGQQDDQVVPKNDAEEHKQEVKKEDTKDQAANYNGDDGNEADLRQRKASCTCRKTLSER
ncbi:Golgi membrane protein 1 isoform X2 [Microcaecilia unicolor]|uniref:Golgi membrane protein 1 isoform X2 n=1 Tax=Microcaecilia unicolor TaxID=1415580 RepID=A0A6P7XFV8_9AMPH|nr:Golgi membrane protein 1 isoform X2 [Microcaecilia unicolor]